jgi:hypothetical protein
MSALTKMSFKLLGFLTAKTGGSLKILHSSGLLQRTNHQKTAWGTEMSSKKEGLQQCEH